MHPKVVEDQPARSSRRDQPEKGTERLEKLDTINRLLCGVGRHDPPVHVLEAADRHSLEPELVANTPGHSVARQHPGLHLCLLRGKHRLVGEIDSRPTLYQGHQLCKAGHATVELILRLFRREQDLVLHDPVLDPVLAVDFSDPGSGDLFAWEAILEKLLPSHQTVASPRLEGLQRCEESHMVWSEIAPQFVNGHRTRAALWLLSQDATDVSHWSAHDATDFLVGAPDMIGGGRRFCTVPQTPDQSSKVLISLHYSANF